MKDNSSISHKIRDEWGLGTQQQRSRVVKVLVQLSWRPDVRDATGSFGALSREVQTSKSAQLQGYHNIVLRKTLNLSGHSQ